MKSSRLVSPLFQFDVPYSIMSSLSRSAPFFVRHLNNIKRGTFVVAYYPLYHLLGNYPHFLLIVVIFDTLEQREGE